MAVVVRRMGGFWVGVFLAAGLVGCVPADRAPVKGSRPSESGYQVAVDTTLVEEGRQSYEIYCVGCHGANGDGKGVAARFLYPKPRDFTQANFKFSSRRSGQLPTDEDLLNTITDGLRGTSMPPWKLLPERQRLALIAYIKTLSDKWLVFDPAPAVPVVEDPFAGSRDKSAAIARGEAVYHGLATCWTCHPAYVSTNRVNDYLGTFENPARTAIRANLGHGVARLNSEKQVVFIPDFRRDFVRAGHSIPVLYFSIAAGITGTAMPTWVDAIEIEGSGGDYLSTRGDLWALAYYVQSLIAQRPPLLAEGVFVLRDRTMIVAADSWEPVVAETLRRPAIGGGEEAEEEEEEDE